MDYAQMLAKTFLFKDFPAAELKKLAGVAQEERLAAQSELFREGDGGEQLCVIVLGTVKVFKRNRDGVDEEVAQLGTGSYFGEMVIVDDEHVRSATVVTQEPTTVLSFKRGDIEKLCAADDKLARHFYFAVARGLARRLSATTTEAAFYRTLAKQRHG